MRLRTDSGHIAGWKRAHDLRGCACGPDRNHVSHIRRYRSVPRAEVGDVWRIGNYADGTIRGYALTCPRETCDQGVHFWDHAYDCPNRRTYTTTSCCWTWAGSPEEGTLTASPSLHVLADLGGCGWHGWLQNGQMTPA